MTLISTIALLFIAFLHYCIFTIEVFFWTKPSGLRAFNLSKEFSDQTKTMAINQGVYNAFLASGILYAILTSQPNTAIFFTSCVFIAGIVGGVTSNIKIIFIQSIPALIALMILFFKI
jgi:putative membrane protein